MDNHLAGSTNSDSKDVNMVNVQGIITMMAPARQNHAHPHHVKFNELTPSLMQIALNCHVFYQLS